MLSFINLKELIVLKRIIHVSWFQDVALIPNTAFRWLNRRAYVAISGPGNGSEIEQWLSRLEQRVRGRSTIGGVEEIQTALEDSRFQLIMRDMVNLARSNSINCSNELGQSSSDCFTSNAGGRLLRAARNLVRLNRDFLGQIVAQALDARNASKFWFELLFTTLPTYFCSDFLHLLVK